MSRRPVREPFAELRLVLAVHIPADFDQRPGWRDAARTLREAAAAAFNPAEALRVSGPGPQERNELLFAAALLLAEVQLHDRIEAEYPDEEVH